MKHPLHPALVHFPIACWALGTVADGLGLWWYPTELQWFAAVLIAFGCAAGLVAAAAGFVELLKLSDGHPAERDAYTHMTLALVSWCLYAGSLFLRVAHRELVPPGTVALALSGVGLATLLATGWMGGKLVYGHGVGVDARN